MPRKHKPTPEVDGQPITDRERQLLEEAACLAERAYRRGYQHGFLAAKAHPEDQTLADRIFHWRSAASMYRPRLGPRSLISFPPGSPRAGWRMYAWERCAWEAFQMKGLLPTMIDAIAGCYSGKRSLIKPGTHSRRGGKPAD